MAGPGDGLGDREAGALGGEPVVPAPPALEPGRLSALLADLARAPEATFDSAWAHVPRAGERIGRFQLLGEIGRGGFGVVFEARDLELQRVVALKLLRPAVHPGGARNASLEREAEAAAKLRHPNVVTLHDAGRWEGGPYLVYERLEGETLADRLWREERLPLREALRVSREVARALAHAHAAGVVHRDLKPSNVYLETDGGVKLLDLGLAALGGDAGTRGGTPGAMAPEQWRGQPDDARTDVFAAGVLLYRMLSGGPPFRAPDGADVLSPQPAPALRARFAPAPVRRAVASALAKNPAARPADGGAWLRMLDAAALAARHRRIAVRAALALAAAAAIAAPLLARRAPAPAERIRVALADAVNESGAAELDGLAGLLATSLEQSRRLRVVTRTRMLDLLRSAGRAADRLDAPSARDASRRAGADALLVPTARRFGDTFVVDVAAVDLRSDENLFALREEARGLAAVTALVDRLSTRIRETLQEHEAEVRSERIDVARAVTPSLEAYRYYFEGEDCLDRPMAGVRFDCAEKFERAIIADPDFPLAHYRIAWILGGEAPADARQRAEIAAALRGIERVPPRERALILAWKAHLDGRDGDAMAEYRRAIELDPDDKRTLFLAGDLLYHAGDYARGVEYFERVAALDPSFGWALDHLVWSLGLLERRGALARHASAWSAAPPRAPVLHALSLARGWLGDGPGAVEAARRELAEEGGPQAERDLVQALAFTGDTLAAEALLRSAIRREEAPAQRFALAGTLLLQGRRREAFRELDEIPGIARDQGDLLWYHAKRADYLLGDRDVRLEADEVARLEKLNPSLAATYAFNLAYLGDVRRGDELARGLPPGAARDLYAAIAAWRRGDPLRAVERLTPRPGDPPLGLWVLSPEAPAFLLAEALSDARDDAAALAAFQRFRAVYQPLSNWRVWAFPRSRVLMARILARMGRTAEAGAELDRLVTEWAHADADAPLLGEARALRAELEARRPAPRPATPPAAPRLGK
ncbi:MAG TPA: protein kinase [Anaeromyxobacteraceae bacterium]|nr:protein kinase [Anaeromyxobacteraceae bacterium]